MVDIKSDRWSVPDNVFASRVMLPDLKNVFEPQGFFRWLAKTAGSESIVIEPGTVAYFIEDGQEVGYLPSGQHTMQGVLECLKFWKIKQATVILTRGEDQHLNVDLEGIPTRVGLMIDAQIRLSIQIKDVASFLDNYMGVASEISFDHLSNNLVPIITQSAEQAIRLKTPEELQSGVLAETLSTTVSEQLSVRMKRYGLNFIQIETVEITHQGLTDLNEQKGKIWLAEQKLQDNLRRLKVNSDLRKQHTSDAMDKIETREEYLNFISQVDKDKLIREDDVEELSFEFDNRKSDRKTLRDHMVRLLDIKRDFELESLNSEFEYQTDLTALNREIELAGVSHTKDSAALIQMLELQKQKRSAKHDEQRADWALWRDKQDVKRDESWESALHRRQLQDVETDIAVGGSERDSRVALIEDELQNKLANSKLVREQRRKEFELEIEDKESGIQMDRLRAVQSMNAKFTEDEARLKSELEELKLEKSGQRRIDEIKSLKGSTTDELVALTNPENARLLAAMKTNDVVTQGKKDASEQALKLVEEKGTAVAQALKDAMQDVKDISITAVTGNASRSNNSNASATPAPPGITAPTAISQWYLARDGKTLGPWPHDEFLGFVSGGTVTADCKVQKVGANIWMRAGDCVEFQATFGGSSSPPPPPPPPPSL